MKLFNYCLVAALCLGAACQNPQKHDEKMADEKAKEATQSAEASAMHDAAANANAANAAVAAVQSAINDAMSKVPMPDFKKANAKNLAQDFHKYLSDLVNTNSGKKASEYMDKLTSLKDEYNKKVAEQKIDPEDKTKLETYYNALISAVQTAAP